MTQGPDESPAEAMRRRSADWAAGAAEGRAYNHRTWLAMTPAERVGEDAALLRLVSEHDVPFVVIGGWAVISHGYVRITRDVDLLVPDRPDVHERAAAAMASVHAKRFDDREVSPGETIPPQGWQLLTDLGRIDLLLEGLPPLDFESVLSASLPSEMAGVPFRYAGLATLVAFKRLAGRPHDRLDLEEHLPARAAVATHGPERASEDWSR